MQIHLDNAKKEKLFYVVINAVVFRPSDKKCLILKRDAREKVHPNKWALPGGKVEWADLKVVSRMDGEVTVFENVIEEVLRREIKEESGVEVNSVMRYLGHAIFVRGDGIPVVLLYFATEYVVGEVVPEVGGFTAYAWVGADEVHSYDCIKGVPEEIKKTIKLLS